MINADYKELPIVFFGTPAFAATILEDLLNHDFTVIGVVTAPDKPAGRGRKLIPPDVKITAEKAGIPVLQPTNLKDPDFLGALREWNPELQVVVAFRMLPEAVWALPRHGTFNLHASLLPQYRGAAPIQHVLLNGEKNTGVTTFFIDDQIDTGKIILQNKIQIDPLDDAGSLTEKLCQSGSELVRQTIKGIAEGTIIPKKQTVQEPLKMAPKIKKEDTLILWHESPERIVNRVRAFSPKPGAAGFVKKPDGKILQFKIFRAIPEYKTHNHLVPSWVLAEDNSIKIAVPQGFIRVMEIQIEGKKRMSAENLLRGFDLLNTQIVLKDQES